MKKRNLLVLGAALVLSIGGLVSCGNSSSTATVALVTDVGNIDDHSFNQSTWEGVKGFCSAKNISYNYYRPSEDSTEARETTMKQAINNGAKVVVLPGYLFETAVYDLQAQFPKVKFLLIDGEPHTADYKTYKTEANTTNILFKEEQPGYLAGYSAVMEGYTKLGFVGGMAVPAVIRYGYGYVQGINAAAKVKHAADATYKVNVNYWYSGTFAPSDTIQSTASSWYSSGTQCVFSCGGSIYQSVLAGISSTGTMIGVDTDQYYDSDKIITSAMKELNNSVQNALGKLLGTATTFTDDSAWPTGLTGVTRTLGAADDMIGLAHGNSWRLKNYTDAQYQALYADLKAGKITVDNSSDDKVKPTTESYVVVDYK
jgi:Uncharacterized ABC-type transport system, periplasmic component/surface lipoprotein